MARLRPETRDAVRDGAIRSASTLLPLISPDAPTAILDVGAGEGHWLDAAGALWPEVKLAGVDIEASRGGLVHEWDAEILDSPLPLWHTYVDADLAGEHAPEAMTARWPLVLCLEVAEHVSPVAGDHLIAELCRVAERVAFSAAIPGQGGDGHVNEQWPAYWQERFQRHGFFLSDPWRTEAWSAPGVEPWYAQNLLLAMPASLASDGSTPRPGYWDDAHLRPRAPLSLVHPAVFQAKLDSAAYWREQWGVSQAEVERVRRACAEALS